MKIHLIEYTEDEIRAMPAGDLLDWLVLQAMGNQLAESQKEFQIRDESDGSLAAFWWKDSHCHICGDGCHDTSRAPGAAMRALEWYALQNQYGCQLSFFQFQGEWFFGVPVLDKKMPTVESAHTPYLAIARGVAIYGLRRQSTEKEQEQ